MYEPEKYQLGIVIEYLRKNNIQFETEAILYSIPIDILAVDSGEVIAIELKTKDIKKGLTQAERNLEYADYSYLSVWKSNVSDRLIERLHETKIGLMGIEADVEVLSPADKNIPNEYAKANAKKLIA